MNNEKKLVPIKKNESRKDISNNEKELLTKVVDVQSKKIQLVSDINKEFANIALSIMEYKKNAQKIEGQLKEIRLKNQGSLEKMRAKYAMLKDELASQRKRIDDSYNQLNSYNMYELSPEQEKRWQFMLNQIEIQLKYSAYLYSKIVD